MGNTKIRPIAMKCNKEQFEAIKWKLELMEFHSDLYTFFTPEKYSYLTNNYNKQGIISSTLSPECHEETYGTWNEEIFLNACGIDTEPTYTITKEQVQDIYNDGCTYVKKWFPDVFEVKLKVGKWYKWKNGKALFNYQEDGKIYGFLYGKWHITDYWTWVDLRNIKEATEQEVFEALKNEAVKRGFKEGVYVNNSNLYGSKFKNYCMEKGIIKYSNKELILYTSEDEHYCFFRNGVWAEIITTLTKKEAEQKLNCKIV